MPRVPKGETMTLSIPEFPSGMLNEIQESQKQEPFPYNRLPRNEYIKWKMAMTFGFDYQPQSLQAAQTA